MIYICYPTNNTIAILAPVVDSGLSLDEIAKKDVPHGTPYKFLQDNELPNDRTFRNAWEIDFSNPDGYGV
jgi:hypothetical protein